MTGLLVAFALIVAPAPKYAGAAEIISFDFPERADRDFFKPEDWRRVIRPGFPFYIDAELTKEAAATGNRSLVFRLNGGSCAYESPLVEAVPNVQLVVVGQIKTVGLKRDKAYLKLELLDGEQKVVGAASRSEPVSGTSDWTRVQVGPVTPPENVRSFRLVCLSEADEDRDLTGTVYFDDLWVGKLPRVEMKVSELAHLFPVDRPKVISLFAYGAEGRKLVASLQVKDVDDKVLFAKNQILAARGATLIAEFVLPLNEPGFYPLHASVHEETSLVFRRESGVTVVGSPGSPSKGFGLSLTKSPFGLDHAERLARNSASAWLKTPLWGDELEHPDYVGAKSVFTEFTRRTTAVGHAIVGSLERPGSELRRRYPNQVASLFDVVQLPEEAWTADIKDALVRFGPLVTAWRLGADDDERFATNIAFHPTATPKTRRLVQTLSGASRFGVNAEKYEAFRQRSDVEFVSTTFVEPKTPIREWSWLEPRPVVREPPVAGVKFWEMMSPASATIGFGGKQALAQQAERLVQGYLNAKDRGVDVFFAKDVFDPQRGLVDSFGAPNAMYTVWRNLASVVGDLPYVGLFPTAEPTAARLFANDESAAILLSARSPQAVSLTLGPTVQVIDLWGRGVTSNQPRLVHELRAEATPILIAGVAPGLARFQQHFSIRPLSDGQTRAKRTLQISASNTFGVPIQGEIQLKAPFRWRLQPDKLPIAMKTDTRQDLTFVMEPPDEDYAGPVELTLHFQIRAKEAYVFSLKRQVESLAVGVLVDVATKKRSPTRVDVEVRLTNKTPQPISIKGSLRAFHRNTVNSRFDDLAPGKSAILLFQLPFGADLVKAPARLELVDVEDRARYVYSVPIKFSDDSP